VELAPGERGSAKGPVDLLPVECGGAGVCDEGGRFCDGKMVHCTVFLALAAAPIFGLTELSK
jgi:hypothetical protein